MQAPSQVAVPKESMFDRCARARSERGRLYHWSMLWSSRILCAPRATRCVVVFSYSPPHTPDKRATGLWATRAKRGARTEHRRCLMQHAQHYFNVGRKHRSSTQASRQRRREGGAGGKGGMAEPEQTRNRQCDDNTHTCAMLMCLGTWSAMADQVPPQDLQRRASHRTRGPPTLCLLQGALMKPTAAENSHKKPP